MSAPKSHSDRAQLVSAMPEVLVVEDEVFVLREMSRLLKQRGFRVREASRCEEAIQQADEGNVAVVLMDVVLGGDRDGIDLAREIQSAHPYTSIIFVSAYASDPAYRNRADLNHVRTGGWIEKPIVSKIRQLAELISREVVKTAIRSCLATARSKGVEPEEYLRIISEGNSSLAPEIIREILAELSGSGVQTP